MIDSRRLSVRLVLHSSNRAWILEKFADRLVHHLGEWGVDADISDMPSASADLHHFMMYLHGPKHRVGPATTLVTHVDRPHKVVALRRVLDQIDVAICVSRMTVDQLVGFNLPARQLCFVVPGCDPVANPRRTVIVVASRLYRDMRKREDLLIRLARSMSLENFQFDILGLGWEEVAAALQRAGAVVNYFPPSSDYVADHDLILDRFRGADYFFYPGLDEGSMGLLDALALGLPTISTPQGFHLDIPGGLTHPFWDFPELLAIFERLGAERRNRIDVARRFGWDEYARRHAIIWRAVLERRDTTDLGTLLDAERSDAHPPPPSRSLLMRRWAQMYFDEGKRITSYLWKITTRSSR